MARMNAVEKIEAAITKLERLRSRASDGTWGENESPAATVSEIRTEIGRSVAHDVPYPDAELIVTLHRTIDAQLAILRNAVTTYRTSYAATQRSSPAVDVPPGVHYLDPTGADRTASYHVRRELALADAILGGVS